jgi:hypothetical protein
MSTVGDPLTDVAHLLVYWEPTCGRVTHPAQLIADRPGFMSGGELIRAYEDRTGRDLDGLPFYLAFEHWRAAIIKDAIFLRRAPGQPQVEEVGGRSGSISTRPPRSSPGWPSTPSPPDTSSPAPRRTQGERRVDGHRQFRGPP